MDKAKTLGTGCGALLNAWLIHAYGLPGLMWCSIITGTLFVGAFIVGALLAAE